MEVDLTIMRVESENTGFSTQTARIDGEHEYSKATYNPSPTSAATQYHKQQGYREEAYILVLYINHSDLYSIVCLMYTVIS